MKDYQIGCIYFYFCFDPLVSMRYSFASLLTVAAYFHVGEINRLFILDACWRRKCFRCMRQDFYHYVPICIYKVRVVFITWTLTLMFIVFGLLTFLVRGNMKGYWGDTQWKFKFGNAISIKKSQQYFGYKMELLAKDYYFKVWLVNCLAFQRNVCFVLLNVHILNNFCF